jgi:hypothetical protein
VGVTEKTAAVTARFTLTISCEGDASGFEIVMLAV